MSRFNRYDRIAGQTVDHMFAEAFALTPMQADPNGRPRLAADRHVIIGQGVFNERDVAGSREGGRWSREVRTWSGGKTMTLSVARDAFAGHDPSQGDVVDRRERGESYEVKSVHRDHSRLLLVLVARGR